MKIGQEIRAICFDMDGTLLDTKVDYSRMTSLILGRLRKAGVPEELLDDSQGYKLSVDRAFVWMLRNKGGEEIQSISDSIASTARDLEMERVDEARPFPGVPEMLRTVRSKGYRIGVLTRGCREYAETALEISGINGLIDALVARDDHPEKEAKPNPVAMKHMADAVGVRTDEILYVGDHEMDWMCARDASSKFVGVESGTFTKANWADVDPDILILPTCAGITDLLRLKNDSAER